ncbi:MULTISPECIES: DUF5787 family protein [Halolamina]|uniref:Uncharacterized protein n=1 Tax=Halolamina pelagica TaxID=699431 RepID=A0A1I5Q317_9EURY|nr:MULTISPECIES: DUF5787 family protein [Halolamina]NHX35074.1 hypothetical protein [Halolamina sp. R1-12]SFP40625.1 hypothetical protein SAMN05216277_103232 [Halolamina pelagica]
MEVAFELALSAHLEAATDWVLARQLGAAVERPGARVMDIVGVAPTAAVTERAAITGETIPPLAVESGAGVGEAVPVADALDCGPERAEAVAERAAEIGFFERGRRGGRTYVRRTARYPDWVGKLVGIENKPDLGRPGDLDFQLRFDAALALFDEVWLATESYVTGAHLNRIPDSVGVWRFDPETGERETVRAASTLAADDPGVELRAEEPLRTDVSLVSADAKARQRRRIAERAWGKGWRPAEFPGCANCSATEDAVPYCAFHGRPVAPSMDCGSDCPGYEAGEEPAVDPRRLRDERTAWVRDPAGVASEQSGLDQF